MLHPGALSAVLALLAFGIFSSEDPNIDTLNELIAYLTKHNQSQIGVLSMSNFNSIRNILPPGTQPLVFGNEQDLWASILNDTIVAGLTSGLPDRQYYPKFNIIHSGSIALQTVFMAPDYSTDFPNGVKDPSLSTKQLSIAINAAIAMIQHDGVDQQLAKKNWPKEITQSYSCKVPNFSDFELPNKSDAAGLLADVFRTRTLRVLAYGPFNWGNNDGNYLIDPPVGFYPDLLTTIGNYFANLSGPDGEKYGEVSIQRFYSNADYFPWYKLFTGELHMSEPYFLLDTLYGGSGKPCRTDADCLPSSKQYQTETCNSQNFCEQPVRPKILTLRSSCTTLGTESVFTTKKHLN